MTSKVVVGKFFFSTVMVEYVTQYQHIP